MSKYLVVLLVCLIFFISSDRYLYSYEKDLDTLEVKIKKLYDIQVLDRNTSQWYYIFLASYDSKTELFLVNGDSIIRSIENEYNLSDSCSDVYYNFHVIPKCPLPIFMQPKCEYKLRIIDRISTDEIKVIDFRSIPHFRSEFNIYNGFKKVIKNGEFVQKEIFVVDNVYVIPYFHIYPSGDKELNKKMFIIMNIDKRDVFFKE